MASSHDAARDGGSEEPQLSPEEYTVGWICAVTTEYVAAQVFLDQRHAPPTFIATNDNNDYTLGRIGKHNVAIAVLPGGEYGTASAAGVARDMLHSFPNIRIGLLVGIGGGAPSPKHDIRLGDVVVSQPQHGLGGVIQYKAVPQDEPFRSSHFLASPPPVLLTAISGLRAEHEINGHTIHEDIEANLHTKKRLRKKYSRPDKATDQLYDANAALSDGGAATTLQRQARDEDDDDPAIHYGLIATADELMTDAKIRDQYAERGVLCFEMEAGGLMNHFPCLVVRGICDYCDAHKTTHWQGYAAMAAAAYAKDLIKRIIPNKVLMEKKLGELVANALTTSLVAVEGIKSLQTASHLNQITEWLSAPDPSTNFNKALELHQPGTGQWLLDSAQYQSWKEKQASFLWLHGIPGCGKTILSSTVITDLAANVSTSATLLYFYFNFTDVEKRSTEKAVRSLITQLYHQSEESRGILDALYEKHGASRQPTHAVLQTTLQDMIRACSSVWIVLDGLDECEARSEYAADGVMPWIKNLRMPPSLHLLVTSRPEEDIKSAIETWADNNEIISLQSDVTADDIHAYVRARVEQLVRWETEPDMRQQIVTTLTERAGGMFRWVVCQFDTLGRCLSRKDMLQALATLPQTLDATYAQMLERIYPEYKPTAIRLLQLLTYSQRPLRIEEAVDLIAIEPAGSPRFDPRNRIKFPNEITRYCSSFVTITTVGDEGMPGESETEIHLAHFSVQEYFRSNRLTPALAKQFDKTVAAATAVELYLAYLLSMEHRRNISSRWPLAFFAAQSWPYYAAVVQRSGQEMPEIVQEFYASEDNIRLSLTFGDPDRNTRNKLPPPTRLYHAAFHGFLDFVLSLLAAGADVNAEGGHFGTALQAASYRQHAVIIQVLLEHGADVNIQSGRYGTALTAASCKGDDGIVNMLLQAGADVNLKGGCYGTALQAALAKGHLHIAHLLLERGADVNAEGGSFGGPLQAASYGGHDSTIQLLLQKGANLHAQGGMFGDALQAASSRGHQHIVEMLLQKGAVENSGSEPFGSALQAAAWGGQRNIVQLLLDGAADINAQGGKYGSALNAASEQGHTGIVQMLLEGGADLNRQCGKGGAALTAASKGGNRDTVQMLLDRGADVNAQGGEYGSALNAASEQGHTGIVQMLLEGGADLNLQCGKQGNALMAASKGGNRDTVQMLLDRGADVNAQGGEYGSALNAASKHTHMGIVQVLLDGGADVNLQCGKQGNALMAASEARYPFIIEMLLYRGADINARGGAYGSALLTALLKGSRSAVLKLLSYGADLNEQDAKQGNALVAASKGGHRDLVQLLLDKGADVNAHGRGKFNGSALQNASDNCHRDIVQILLEHGAVWNGEEAIGEEKAVSVVGE